MISYFGLPFEFWLVSLVAVVVTALVVVTGLAVKMECVKHSTAKN